MEPAAYPMTISATIVTAVRPTTARTRRSRREAWSLSRWSWLGTSEP